MQHPIETTELKATKLEVPINELPKPKKRKIFRKSFVITLAILIVAVLGISLVGYNTYKNSQNVDVVKEPIIKTVKTITISSHLASSIIKTVGQVKAGSQINVVSKSRGKVIKINFNLGSYITQGTVLAELEDETTKRSFETAQVGLQSATDNLTNALALQTKTEIDAKNNALNATINYKSAIKGALDQINYIILAEAGNQLPFIASVLSAKNGQALITAKAHYIEAKESYESIKNQTYTSGNIAFGLEKIISSLLQIQKVIDSTILVLDNTVTSASFSGASLLSQQGSFAVLKTSINNTKTSAELTLQNLENLSLINKRELDALSNAKNLSFSQFNLTKASYNNLFIKAPISGKVTDKDIELGREIMPNQNIAEISQTGSIKVEIHLTPEEASLINTNQPVLLNNNLTGRVVSIAPTANSLSKKIKVEISVSPNASLVPGSFADVLIEANTLDSSNAIFIPLTALTLAQSESYVFIVNENKAEKRVVEIGKVESQFIEITNGLSFGEEIITTGSKELSDGEKIRIKIK